MHSSPTASTNRNLIGTGFFILLLLFVIASTAIGAQTSNLTTLGAYDLMNDVQHMAVDGNYVYIGSEECPHGEGKSGLWVVDISDRANPEYVSHRLLCRRILHGSPGRDRSGQPVPGNSV